MSFMTRFINKLKGPVPSTDLDTRDEVTEMKVLVNRLVTDMRYKKLDPGSLVYQLRTLGYKLEVLKGEDLEHPYLVKPGVGLRVTLDGIDSNLDELSDYLNELTILTKEGFSSLSTYDEVKGGNLILSFPLVEFGKAGLVPPAFNISLEELREKFTPSGLVGLLWPLGGLIRAWDEDYNLSITYENFKCCQLELRAMYTEQLARAGGYLKAITPVVENVGTIDDIDPSEYLTEEEIKSLEEFNV